MSEHPRTALHARPHPHGEDVRMSEHPRPTEVDVTLSIGSVHVIAGAGDVATVTVGPGDPQRQVDVDAAARAEVAMDDGRLLVRAQLPKRLLIGPSSKTGHVAIVLEVPTGVALRCTADIADVRVDGPLGDVHVKVAVGALRLDRTGELVAKTTAGDVVVDRVEGDADLTGSGEVRLASVAGAAALRNLNGAVWVGEAGGAVRARSDNGAVVVERAHGDVQARTANGDISVGAVRRGTVDLKTGYGAVSVGVVEGTAVLVDASSGFGRVDNQLTASQAPPEAGERAELKARTSFGDIVIHRS
jgi:hypothetical protein